MITIKLKDSPAGAYTWRVMFGPGAIWASPHLALNESAVLPVNLYGEPYSSGFFDYFFIFFYDAGGSFIAERYWFYTGPGTGLQLQVGKTYEYSYATNLFKLVESATPRYYSGAPKTARARLTNPTAKQFTYAVELYLGAGKEATSEAGEITIPAGSYMDVDFWLSMPVLEGSYPVYLDVWCQGNLLKHYRDAQDVVIEINPLIEVGPITWL